MKAIVHIGTEKTGTSSIQLFLHKNRKLLQANGYHYLKSAGAQNHWALPAYCSEGKRFDDFYRLQSLETEAQMKNFRQDFLSRFDDEIRSLPSAIHTVIISSEHFHSRLRTENEMLNLKNLLDQYFSEVRILCYLREQAATCESWYSTSMKSGATYSFYEFLRRCKPQSYYFNYYDVLTNWARFFGRKSINAALFDRRRFADGNLCVDFANRVEQGLAGRLDTTNRSVNASLKPMGQALVRALNMQFPLGETNETEERIRRTCQDVVIKKMTGKGQRMALERRQKIYDIFRESNEKLRCDYFPMEEVLFDPPEQEGETEPAVDSGFLQTLNDLFKVFDAEKNRKLSPQEYEDFWRAIITSARDVVDISDEVIRGAVEVYLTEDHGRLFRRAAMYTEWSDIASADQLMMLAQSVAPGLPGMRKKLEDYKAMQQEASAGLVDHAFMMIFRGSNGDLEREVDPDVTRRLADWMQSLNTASGTERVVPLSQASTVVTAGMTDIDNDPQIKAYTIFKASSLQEAVEIAESCPHLEAGGTLEVFKVEKL